MAGMRTPTEEHLRLLAIFHWVMAGFSLLICALPVAYVAMGYLFVSGTFVEGGRGPPAPFGWILVIFGVIGFLLAVSYTTLLVLSARSLSSRRRWLLVVVTAGLSCALFPVGTVLGVFTFAVLLKPEVRALFGQPVEPWGGPAQGAAPPPWPPVPPTPPGP